MRKVYTWAAVPAQRNLTVADLRAGKNQRKFTQVTANTAEEAHAAGVAGLDMIICNAANVEAVRAGNNELFLTAALGLPDYPAQIDVMRGAHQALALGADAVMTARSMAVVEMLAHEDMPVMGHLGLVPRKSTWIGGLRAFGKTGDEAIELYRRFRRLEDAGAFAVEAEVIPGPVMGLISRNSGLITVSLGSGGEADVMYLFMEDICGEKPSAPRHAKAYCNLYELREKIKAERIRALKEFCQDAMDGKFPYAEQTAAIDPEELVDFERRLVTARSSAA